MRTLLIENIVFIGVLVTVTSVAWSLVYTDPSNYHFNVVLFPLAAINGDSPFIPLLFPLLTMDLKVYMADTTFGLAYYHD
ncbi:hypothetical protein MiYa_04424 [Microcystis aeruginosa NIES-2519]|uniref:Uncharacterized protein n=1 Tax=Microcystis aeruginosa NIES-2519 TaxID=2303981 RepID=A0A5A5RDF7_MICAE|nr:hypothetical protein [Microcystis aeruginosa]GCA72869.1 hypothetical protein MiYa_04424 [Microcystis aeruginosa NIES-2519]GCA86299.1 hypothetical protein MiHa_04290 [Microcystis aeruginosa NIES-2522]